MVARLDPAESKRPGACGERASGFRPDRFKSLLAETGTSESLACRIMGIGQGIVNAWSRGKCRPMRHYVERLAYWFDCPPEYLTGESNRRLKSERIAEEKARRPRKRAGMIAKPGRVAEAQTVIEDSHGQEMTAHA